MKKFTLTTTLLASALVLSGCIEGTTAYKRDPNTVIATARDFGRDATTIPMQRAAIAYDPDGCQNWLIDDGLEGYATPRFDTATGMANVCNNHFPPGAVVGEYQTPGRGINDRVPRRTGFGYQAGERPEVCAQNPSACVN